jgi:tetratricopeptide (TPR) repeat protein
VILRVLGAALALTTSAGAQQPDPSARAFDLERRGLHPQAAELYRSILTQRPHDLGALLGLERSLAPQAKVAEMVVELRRAMAGAEQSAALYGLAVRVYTAAGQHDSARSVVDRWAVVEPKSEGPYQEWGSAALSARDRQQARAAYQQGRTRLGSDALAGEIAQLATIEADYATAVTEWLVAIGKVPGYRSSAVSLLSQVPVPARPGVLRYLEQARTASGERVAAILTLRWGDPVGGIRRLERAIPLLNEQTVEAIQEGLDELRGQSGREVGMARGIGLEILGSRVPAQTARYLLDAAQAYADAGDQASARRMLGRLASDTKGSPTMAASATSTLVTVLVAEGKLEEATKQYQQLKQVLAAEERQQLQLRIAEGWIRQGKLDRAEQMVAQDSTIEALAVRGRIRLYLGDLSEASTLMRYAGPFAGAREAAVSRTTALALIQVIDDDSVPALGGALLKLERRDSVGASEDLEKVAAGLPPERGGAETLLLAARLRAGLRDATAAERLFERVAQLKVPAAAAAAELELARLMVDGDRKASAVETLEHLLITYPTSAVAPQARRLLDVAKGAIPPQ